MLDGDWKKADELIGHTILNPNSLRLCASAREMIEKFRRCDRASLTQTLQLI